LVSATTTSSQIYYVTIEPLEDLENERVEESVTTAIIPIQTASISPALTNTADTVSATLVRTSTMPSNYTSSTLTNSPLPTSTATSAGNMQVIIQYSIIGGGSLAALLLTALTIYVYRRRRHTKRMRSRAQSQFNSTANMLNMESIEMTKIAAKGDGTLYGLDATCMTSMNTEIARSIATLVTPQRELTVPAFLQRETKDFTTLKQIAKGGGGTVFMAKTSHPEILSKEPSGRIIVKVFERPENPSPAIQKDFIQSFDQEVAIIIYELLTRLYPWKELGSLNDLHKCVKEGERPSLTSEIRRLLDTNDDVTTLYRVMVKCWHGDPFARPKMTAVLNQLRNK